MNWMSLIICLLINAVVTVIIVKGMTMKIVTDQDRQINTFMKEVLRKLS